MIWVLSGEETLQPQELIDTLRRRFVRNVGAAAVCVTIECDEEDVDTLLSTLRNGGLFATQRFIVVRNPFALPTSAQRTFAEAVRRLPKTDDLIVIHQRGALPNRRVLTEALQQTADKILVYDVPQGAELRTLIARIATRYGCTITPAAADHIASVSGKDTQQMAMYVAQCAAAAPECRITEAITEQWCGTATHSRRAFDVVAAVFTQSRAVALAQLQQLLRDGEDPFKVFGLYAYHVRTLLVCEDDAASATCGIAPFARRAAQRMRRRCSEQTVREAQRRLAQLDIRVKSGNLDIVDALQDFVLSTARP